MRAGWALAAVAGLVVGWACGVPDAFTCSSDAACEGGPGGGTCVEGYCAFPSDVCSSGLQYGDHAGAASGTCVPAGGSDEGSSGASEGEATGPGPTSLDGASLDSGTGPTEPPAGVIEFRDDALAGEFGAGTMEGVEWAGDRLTLGTNGSQGTFTSRVFDAGATVSWQIVQWMPDGPYGKPLPDDGAIEAGYVEGNVDMTDNVLLLHFEGDGARAWSDGDPVIDASGVGNDGEVVSQGPAIPLVPGVFGTAIDDQWETRIAIPSATAPALAFGTDDFTWALWVRMDSACSNNHVYMGVDDTDASFDVYPHLWLGCTTQHWLECGGNDIVPRAGGTFRSVHDDASDGGLYCGQPAIDGNVWHHLAVVKEGHQSATIRLYVDGALEGVSDVGFAQPIEYPHDPDFTIGAFSRGTYAAVGVLDEVAVWRRALGPDEVAAVHRRGVTSLGVAVRVCSEPQCADDPPWGPLLTDPSLTTSPGLEIPLVTLPMGRYVQYRLELAGAGPALRSVVVRGVVP